MQIFIDESGAFAAVPPARPRFCAVTAVVVREEWAPCLLDQFMALRATWDPTAKEIKGSRLSERQMSQALRLFRAYDVTAFASVIDTGMNAPETLSAFREGQARGILKALEPMIRPHPKFVERVRQDAERWRRLRDPLTMQLSCSTSVVEDVIRKAPLYLAGRSPKDSGAFNWTVDAKAVDGLTDSESLWRDHLCPLLQTIFLEEPPAHVSAPGLDYSHFDRAFGTGQPELPEYLRHHLKKGAKSKGQVFDLKKVMLSHLRFERSEDDAGLQVADIVGSALTRALNGTIAWEGWRLLGKLFIHETGGGVRLVRLGGSDLGPPIPVHGMADRVIRRINVRAKPMLPPPY